MIYLLDTNTCIGYINRRSIFIYQRLIALSPEDVCICDIVKFELYYGAYNSSRSQENLKNLQKFFTDFTSLPFDSQAANICGYLRFQLKTQGTPIEPYDLQIAAIALANNLILVTHNTKEFSRIPQLQLEDWEI